MIKKIFKLIIVSSLTIVLSGCAFFATCDSYAAENGIMSVRYGKIGPGKSNSFYFSLKDDSSENKNKAVFSATYFINETQVNLQDVPIDGKSLVEINDIIKKYGVPVNSKRPPNPSASDTPPEFPLMFSVFYSNGSVISSDPKYLNDDAFNNVTSETEKYLFSLANDIRNSKSESGADVPMPADPTPVPPVEPGDDHDTDKHTFKDVKKSPLKEHVSFVVSKGMMEEEKTNVFMPKGFTYNDDLIFALHALSETEDTDVYEWAEKKGLTKKFGKKKFKPESELNTENAVTVLYRYVKNVMSLDTSNVAGIKKYKDYRALKSYAVTPMKWIIKNKVIKPGRKLLNPGKILTKGDLATILYNFSIIN